VPPDTKLTSTHARAPHATRTGPTTRTGVATTSWAVAAPFFDKRGANGSLDARWLDDFVADDRHHFVKVPAPAVPDHTEWHRRAARRTPVALWRRHWEHGRNALGARTDGVITVFPQLAAMTGLHSELRRHDRYLVAWCFNVGSRPRLGMRHIAQRALRSIDRFVVHSRGEVGLASEWFDLPPERVEFVHLQRAPIPVLAHEETEQPFVVALGSAHRDYATLFRALARTRLPAVVVASSRALSGLRVPSNVTVRSGLSPEACHVLAQRARFSVVCLDDVPVAAGQVTVVEAMRMGRPVVATRGVGTVDYVDDGANGLLVDPGDGRALAGALLRLWDDNSLRATLAAGAATFAGQHLTDEAAAQSLTRILTDVAG
jgi:glycosyltransferase involved in cell wall biosynthesis